MAYIDFTLRDLEQKFGIRNESVVLFSRETVQGIAPSKRLVEQLEEITGLPIKSEKARSELIITPILLELRRITNRFIIFYSGDILMADKEKKLVGECDFILSKNTRSFSINLPILILLEAKKQDMEAGIDQCAAQMLGAQIFNEKSNTAVPAIYGCVTTADDWKFLKLEKQLLSIDETTFYRSELDKILGVFYSIIDFFKQSEV